MHIWADNGKEQAMNTRPGEIMVMTDSGRR